VSRMRCSAELFAQRCTADPGPPRTGAVTARDGPGSAAHHFALRCARDTAADALSALDLVPTKRIFYL